MIARAATHWLAAVAVAVLALTVWAAPLRQPDAPPRRPPALGALRDLAVSGISRNMDGLTGIDVRDRTDSNAEDVLAIADSLR